MTYVILHGTPTNIEKGIISDSGIFCEIHTGQTETPWDFRKSFTRDAEDCLVGGNYYGEKDGGCHPQDLTDEDRKFIHDRWIGLIDLVQNQIDEKGRFDIDILDYFNPEGESDLEWLKNRLRTVIECISRGSIKAEDIVRIMDALEESGF